MITDNKLSKKIVGVYLIDNTIEGTQLGILSKPNLIRRIIIRIFLGWKWISIENLKKNI